ncbi:MAG TPA: hypothetical protein VKU41_19140 [Polyangiaceae bacterium]|nr:hypothetical protein [Polyangiaceae bacterium]
MRAARLAVALAFGTFPLASSSAAPAQSGATLVAIVTAEPGASLTRRVRAELEGLGLDVIVLKPPEEGSPSRAPLERAARSVGAIAAVRLVPSGEGKVEVWVADRVTGKALVRELDAPAGGASDATVAVGSVELLRASLMELHSGEAPHGDAPASPRVRALALPAGAPDRGEPRLGLAFGAGAELGVRGLGPSPDVQVAVWFRLGRGLGARMLGRTSLAPARVVGASGAVEVRSELAGLTATYAFGGARARWSPEVSVGFAAAHVGATGTATPPLVSASDGAWSAAPLAGLGLAVSVLPGLRARADALGAWSLPPSRVRTPAGEIGWWGAPALTITLGIEALLAP